MTKKSIKVEVNNFVQGLITEASPLNFPPNATVDESNFIINRNGTRERRLGMDFENNFQLVPINTTLGDVSSQNIIPYKWTNVGGDASLNILVVQVRTNLHLYNLSLESLSGNPPLAIVNLASTGFAYNTTYSFTSVDGKLVVAAGANCIAVVSNKNGTFIAESKTLKVRDVWGVEVYQDLNYEKDMQYRSGYLYDTHAYNLYNQSWGIPRANKNGEKVDPVALYYRGAPSASGSASGFLKNLYNSTSENPIEIGTEPVEVPYEGGLGKFPSNSETVWVGLQFQPVSADKAPFERIFPELYDQVFGAEVKAARGHFIIDLLRRGSSRAEEIAKNGIANPQMGMKTFGAKADYTQGGATSVCEFAGRVFYAGFSGAVVDGDSRSPNLSNYVMFSQLVKNIDDIVKCYQEGDPTSRESNDLVDSDGGFIRISGAEKILGMVNLGSSLAVFASNGVWMISGGSDDGFKATNYKSDRISSFGTLSGNSVVEDGSRALYWSEDGIYVISKDQLGGYNAQNISEKTIQSLYDSIPTVSKSEAIGIFDTIGKKIRWLYHTGDRFNSSSRTKELILDLSLGAFSISTISNLPDFSTELIAPFSTTPYVISNTSTAVMVNAETVRIDDQDVVVPTVSRTSSLMDIKYLCIKNVSGQPRMTFAYYRNEQFLDWDRSDGVGADAYAYLITGSVTAGDSSVAKQVPYLTMHFYRTEDGVDVNMVPLNQSSCIARSQWDWSGSSNSNKWSPQFQAYRYRRAYLAQEPNGEYDNGFEVVTTKNKIRGRGKAFALRMETEPLKDCKIIGWSLALNGNAIT